MYTFISPCIKMLYIETKISWKRNIFEQNVTDFSTQANKIVICGNHWFYTATNVLQFYRYEHTHTHTDFPFHVYEMCRGY